MVKGPVLISCGGAFSVLSVVKSLLKLLFPMQTWPSPWLFWLYGLVSVVLSALLSPAAIWTDQLPKHLQANLGQYMNSTQLATIYGSIAKARAVTEHRDLVIKSYLDTAWYLEVPTLCLCCSSRCWSFDFQLLAW
ncbi:hypothetical protein CNF00690 [Cryptococcus deneoformans JEC21]|uniref:Uncharacterized protein n=1 Tax=Cryptococcus deneoformans (strain JEC21 / ATCC MYA-565) TaxID=214684 RepID=Q5KFS8_CRYD1|nr:hypothetical protein CNF00690 [Cryptococcus neoformans var. neoformans JEC21]AAW43935.2 hypothetical protein CNF00690 [Cryptococcus neoformans var. neoformans JEC21]